MRPRLGFLGTGWIGRHRMEAIIATNAIEAVAICDPLAECAAEAAKLAPLARIVPSLDSMLDLDLDAVVIATPSALHAEQSIRSLDAGKAVFCQKPLGRSAAEVRGIVEAARRANLLLGVDFSYRHTEGMQRIAQLISRGSLGKLFAIELTFHNAYGPDKPWFYDPAQSGGGCVIDLGVHLVDLALWTLDFPLVTDLSADLFSGGARITAHEVEDYATARFTAGDVAVRLACSWGLNAGRDAVIEAAFYGAEGGAALRNVNGSFQDFTAEHFVGTSTIILSAGPDAWGGRAAAAWADQLARGKGFDAAAEKFILSAEVLDQIYAQRASR